jgi:hypothetical protein
MFCGTGMRVQMPTLLIWGEVGIALGKELTYGTERFVPNLRIYYQLLALDAAGAAG